MGRVGQKNTPPELAVRKILHALGYRYRLHRNDLPGRPDIALPGRKKVIFVHGCFWHRHDCKKATTPKSNSEYWHMKFAENVRRDNNVIAELKRMGWGSMVVWECQTHNRERLAKRLSRFLGS